jgi:hypothetical protein
MTDLVNVLNGVDFEQVKYGRWRNLLIAPDSPIEIETNYVYGEGTVRFYRGRANQPFQVIKIQGLFGELNEVWKLIGRFDLVMFTVSH